MNLHQALADQLTEVRDWSYGPVMPKDVLGAGFRRGLAEIEVRFLANPDADHPEEMVRIVAAEPVLNALMQRILADERD